MSNLELIDAYFGNELTEAEMQAFEKRLQQEPELTKEFEFQKDIVDAIKTERAAELKAMLDKVPVGGGTSGTFTMGKILSTAAVVGMAVLGIYYFWPAEEAPVETTPKTDVTTTPAEDNQPEEIKPAIEEEEPLVAKNKEEHKKPTQHATEKVIEGEAETDKKSPTIAKPEINKPDPVPTFDTQDDLNDSLEAPGGNLITKPDEDHSTLDVEIDNTHKNFSFHYQFKSGKLYLYGSFDKGLYEILEINSKAGKTLFLYYKDKFYPLRTNQFKIVPLEPVKESTLIEKLEKAREEG
ncbi:hypothetical protein LVD17_19635 [Fulvivirga ulvae]|uniref:anti-sigma factor family protein n=1 Tax=Fulvivirga ulvae TaxID=2904245 RepID=UPI001F3FB849|nr:hypothetical protein [Fulvivirga ulvae]UII30507.1 hypothetical protein LVD17_19635 [Fulvivirga ulvae]